MNYITHEGGGGNHGHKLKNVISAYILSHVYGFKFLYVPEPLTDCFGVGHNEEVVTLLDMRETRQKPRKYPLLRIGHFPKTPETSGANWFGEFIEKDCKKFLDNNIQNTLFVCRNYIFGAHTLKKAIEMNLTPPGTKISLLDNVIENLTQKYLATNSHRTTTFTDSNVVNIAIQINRGGDLTNANSLKDHRALRYIFKLDYFEKIIQQISQYLYSINKNFHFYIYTEKLNSEEIVETFSNRSNITVRVGCNRGRVEEDVNLIQGIFHDLVMSDILVTCNSSFSVSSSFFRFNKPFIYHSHNSFEELPHQWAAETNEAGEFDINVIKRYIN